MPIGCSFREYVMEGVVYRIERGLSLFRFGGDLLSHVLRRSTIGVTTLIGRVREGIGSLAVAMTTKPKQRQAGFEACHISVVPSSFDIQ